MRLGSFALLLCLACAACTSSPPPPVPPAPSPEVIVLPAPVPILDVPPDNPENAVGVIGGTVAKLGEFPAVAWSGSCTGTLIAPRVVLTAAHCAPAKGTKWTFRLPNGKTKTYLTERAVLHPKFNKAAFSLGNDIAVCRLSEAVNDIKPAELSPDAVKVGQEVVFAGYGLGGTPQTGQTTGAGILRSGRQKIDFLLPPQWLWMFDQGETSSIAQGDSGGPAFLAGTNTIVGIASGTSVGAGNKVGVYGTYVFETRIDIHYAWLQATLASLK